MNKDLLGRKIKDLIEENQIIIKENEEIVEIKLDEIRPNPNQPRVNFDSQALKQLAESIKEHGVIQPIILKPAADGGYILVAGERRVRASQLAGKKSVPSIVRDYNSIYLTELSILENLQREDLTPIEEAVAYEKAIKNLGLTQAELGKKIGKSRSYITNVIGLLNLPLDVIQEVNKGTLSMGHAKILSKLDDVDFIIQLTKKIKEEQISVRKLEDLVSKKNKRIKKSKISLEEKVTQDYIVEASEYLTKMFQKKANIKITDKEIKIKYNGVEDLKMIIAILSKD